MTTLILFIDSSQTERSGVGEVSAAGSGTAGPQRQSAPGC